MKILLFIQEHLRKFYQFLESLVRLLLLSKISLKVNRRKIHNDCLILGNGPSLMNDIISYPDFLENKDLICVNHFPSTELYEKIKPGLFITSAPDLWLDEIDERFVNQSKLLFDNMASKTNWPLEFYIPYEAKKHKRWQNQLVSNNNIKINYYNNIPVEGWEWFKNLCFNIEWGMPRPHNVMIPSMMISLWKRYETIYLLGTDHNWLKDISVADNNDVLINQKHFYDEKTSKGLPLDKRGKGKRNLAELLHKFMTAFSSYFEVRAYSDYLGVKILNATKGSFIDAFDRIQLKKVKV